MERISLRQKIINELLHTDKLSVKLLCERTGASRVSVSKELSALVDFEIISKAEGSHKYTPSSKIAFIILKLYFDCAELVFYALDGSLYKRERIALLHSLHHDDNVVFLLPRIKKHRDELQSRFQKVFTFLVHDKKISPLRIPENFFTRTGLRSELISRQIEYSSSEESILYINNITPLSFICQNKRAITQPAFPNEKSLQAIQNTFSVIKPSRVMLDGTECITLSNACHKHNIPLQAIIPDTPLHLEEIGIIKEFLFSFSKTK